MILYLSVKVLTFALEGSLILGLKGLTVARERSYIWALKFLHLCVKFSTFVRESIFIWRFLHCTLALRSFYISTWSFYICTPILITSPYICKTYENNSLDNWISKWRKYSIFHSFFLLTSAYSCQDVSLVFKMTKIVRLAWILMFNRNHINIPLQIPVKFLYRKLIYRTLFLDLKISSRIPGKDRIKDPFHRFIDIIRLIHMIVTASIAGDTFFCYL